MNYVMAAVNVLVIIIVLWVKWSTD